MSLQVEGRIVRILDKQTGEGKNGTWEKQDFVIETQDQYPKQVCFTLWGEKTSYLEKLSTGSDIGVKFNIESREYNGKWYTNARAWRIEALEGQDTTPTQEEVPPQLPPDDFVDSSAEDNLPF